MNRRGSGDKTVTMATSASLMFPGKGRQSGLAVLQSVRYAAGIATLSSIIPTHQEAFGG